jgi:hypothetical protein
MRILGADLIEQAARICPWRRSSKRYEDLTKANAEPNSPSKAEWEPIKLFRTIGTKAKKINFDSIPATKKRELTKAIQRVQEL